MNVNEVAASYGNVITEDEVARWFDIAGTGANLPAPQSEHPRAIAQSLNVLRVTDISLRDIQPTNVGLERVKRALADLEQHLPQLIEGSQKSQSVTLDGGAEAWPTREDAASIERLRIAVAEAIPAFHFSAPRKRREPWHAVADLAASAAVNAWKHANSRKLGVGKPTSPAVIFTELALERLGILATDGRTITPDAISKALSRRKKNLPMFRGDLVISPMT